MSRHQMDSMRALMLLGEAQSAITQCCELLGEDVTNDILHQLDAGVRRVRQRFEAAAVGD